MLLTLTSLSSLPVTMMLELSSAKATALTSSWCALTCRVACRDKSQDCQSWASLLRCEAFWEVSVYPCLCQRDRANTKQATPTSV